MSGFPEYRIERLSDFMQVPADRLGVCLAEFADWVEVLRRTEALLRTLVPDHPVDQLLTATQSFVWIDDGARNVTMHLSADGHRLVDAHFPEDGNPSVTINAREEA